MISPDRAITLLFLASDFPYRIADYTQDKWETARYYVVQQMPLAEMLGTTPRQMMEELIFMTTTAAWASLERRTMRCGDIICHARTPFVLTHAEDSPDVVSLKLWPAYGLLELRPEKAETMICV